MDKKKFDGPSFLKPSHTSFGLDDGKNFKAPAVNSSKDVINKEESAKNGSNVKRGAKAWEDDEITANKTIGPVNMTTKMTVQSSSNSTKKVYLPGNIPIGASIAKNINSEEPTEKCYWDAENSKKIQNSTMSIEHETKIIEDVLKVSGISIKPTENQLKEFIKHIKTLNKEIVIKILHQKLNALEITDDPNQIKILIKLLYLVETIIHDKIEGYLDYFQKNMDIFTLILQSHEDNKKITELCSRILSEMKNSEQKTNGKSFEKKAIKSTKNLTIADKPKTEEIISSCGSDKNSLSNPDNKSKFSFIKKKVNVNEPELVQEFENIVKKEPDIFSNLIIKEKEKPAVPNSFSFIKNKKSDVSESTTKKEMNTLANQLEQILAPEAIPEQQESNPKKSVIDLNLLSQCYLNSNSMNNSNTNLNIVNSQPQYHILETAPMFPQNYSMQLIQNPNEMKTNPKHNAHPYVDDMSNPLSMMESSNSEIPEAVEKQPHVKEKKEEYFGFVNDILKKK